MNVGNSYANANGADRSKGEVAEEKAHDPVTETAAPGHSQTALSLPQSTT